MKPISNGNYKLLCLIVLLMEAARTSETPVKFYESKNAASRKKMIILLILFLAKP
jgi:hypothetical protein